MLLKSQKVIICKGEGPSLLSSYLVSNSKNNKYHEGKFIFKTSLAISGHYPNNIKLFYEKADISTCKLSLSINRMVDYYIYLIIYNWNIDRNHFRSREGANLMF